MADKIYEYVCDLLKERGQEKGVDFLKDPTFDFISSQYIDSFSIIGFVSDIEFEFGVDFTSEELQSREFRSVQGLASIIRKKMELRE